MAPVVKNPPAGNKRDAGLIKKVLLTKNIKGLTLLSSVLSVALFGILGLK